MILNILSEKNFITYNKVLAKAIGLEEALVLGQVCSLSLIFHDKEFYFTYAEIQEETCLTEYAVKKAIQNLIKLEILSVTRKGCPCRSWYTINENVIIKILENRNRISSPLENGGTRPSEIGGTSPLENGGIVKEDIITKDMTTEDINIADKPQKEKSEVTIILEAYKQNYETLYKQGKVENEKPVIFYNVAGKLIKELLKIISKDDILKCLDRAILDNWIVSQGYSLNTILSSGQVNKLLNGKSQTTSGYVNNRRPASDSVGCDVDF